MWMKRYTISFLTDVQQSAASLKLVYIQSFRGISPFKYSILRGDTLSWEETQRWMAYSLIVSY